MKNTLMTGTLSIATLAVALGGACLATGNCQSKTNLASAPVAPARGVSAPVASAPVASAPVALASAPKAVGKAKTAAKTIRWHTSLESALKESKRTGKPVFADFYATWCPPCQMMERQTYPDPKVITEAQKWVMLKIDTDKQTDLTVKYGISSLPTLAVLRADGKPVTSVGGFLDAEDFVRFLRDSSKKVAVTG